MEELVLASYIKIMQEGFVENNRQESTTRLLLEPVINQKNACCVTDLDSKKISNLANRKISVPEDISTASAKKEVIDKVRDYFSTVIMEEINPNIKYDTFEKVRKLVISDELIAELKKEELLEIYDTKQFALFLADVFLYTLGRENRIETSVKWKACTRIIYKNTLYDEEAATALISDKNIDVFPKLGKVESDRVYRLEEYLLFDSEYDDGRRVINVNCSTGEYIVCGTTSAENWISKSYMNNAVKMHSVFCKAWVKILNVSNKYCGVQFLIIGDDM